MFSISASCRSKLGTLSNDHHDEDNNSVKKTIVFMCKTTALHVHHAFQYISLTSTARLRREASLCDVSWRTWKYEDKFSFRYLNMDKALKNLTPGKVAYICRIKRFQIDAIKIERTQIHFLVMFSLPSSSSMLKVALEVSFSREQQ